MDLRSKAAYTPRSAHAFSYESASPASANPMRASRTASAPAHRAQPQQRPVTPGGYNLPQGGGGGGGSLGNLPAFAASMQIQNNNHRYKYINI